MPNPDLSAEQVRDLRALAGLIIPPSEAYDVPGADDDKIFGDILRSLERDRDDICRALAHLATLSGGAFAELGPPRRIEVAAAFREAGGAPLSAQVSESTPDTVHVVEASSFQLEQIETFHPWIAVMLNFSADHLDRHPSVDAYGAAKARIFENQTADDWAVINADDPAVLDLARRGRAQQRLFARRALSCTCVPLRQ